MNSQPNQQETTTQRDAWHNCASDYLKRGRAAEKELSCSPIAEAAACQPLCSGATTWLQTKGGIDKEVAIRGESGGCTPHEPGGPPACYGQGHCVPNVQTLNTRRPTRSDLIQWLHKEGRA